MLAQSIRAHDGPDARVGQKNNAVGNHGTLVDNNLAPNRDGQSAFYGFVLKSEPKISIVETLQNSSVPALLLGICMEGCR